LFRSLFANHTAYFTRDGRELRKVVERPKGFWAWHVTAGAARRPSAWFRRASSHKQHSSPSANFTLVVIN